jgi:hypothetical protein
MPLVMSHIVKSFAELSWPVVALDPIHDHVSLQLLALGPPGTSPGTVIPIVQAIQRSRDLLAQDGAWHHGGLNE